MIITKISGGLGNQLFQYAAGKSLALKKNTGLLLDVSSYNQERLRNFELSFFNTKCEFANDELVQHFTNRSFIGKIRDRVLPSSMKKVYRQPFFHFDKNFFNHPADVYLKGYWQSEKYFLPIAEIIRKEFTIKQEQIMNITALAAMLKKVESVSIHIRRGDYTNPAILEMHGILSSAHYQQAIDKILSQFPDAVFYIFSDDMSWVKENLKIQNKVYVSGELSKTAIEDFYLMSQCKHNIIANSSFSWWAAWLNNNKEKIVIAPERWFNTKPTDTQDLIPTGWLKI